MGILEVEASILEKAPFISPDPIFDLFKVHQEDPHPSKVLVGGGTYCDGDGKPWILQSVKLAKAAIEGCGHEYLPIAGLKTFRDRAIDLIFHGTRALEERRVREADKFLLNQNFKY
jgi:aspartate aminotransferase